MVEEEEEEDNPDRIHEDEDIDTGTRPESRIYKQRKRGQSNDDEIIKILKKKIVNEENTKCEEVDEDKLFLLSLVSEMQKIPADRKLKARADVISAIAAAQAPSQPQWPPVGYQGPPHGSQYPPPTFYPFHQPPFGFPQPHPNTQQQHPSSLSSTMVSPAASPVVVVSPSESSSNTSYSRMSEVMNYD